MGSRVATSKAEFHEILHSLDWYEAKKLKQRVKFWAEKPEVGSMEEAQHLALRALKRKRAMQKKDDDIPQEEIDRVVARLKRGEEKSSCGEIVCSSSRRENLISLGRKKEISSCTQGNDFKDILASAAFFLSSYLPLLLLISAAGLTSALLIDRTLEALGADGWQNYAKAFLIEMAILYLTLSKCRGQLEWISKRATGFVFIGLTFGLLHVGIAGDIDRVRRASVDSDRVVNLLEGQYRRAEAAYRELGPNYITKKKEAREELDRLSGALISEREKVKTTGNDHIIEKSGLAMNVLWAGLLALNLLLGHEIVLVSQKGASI